MPFQTVQGSSITVQALDFFVTLDFTSCSTTATAILTCNIDGTTYVNNGVGPLLMTDAMTDGFGPNRWAAGCPSVTMNLENPSHTAGLVCTTLIPTDTTRLTVLFLRMMQFTPDQLSSPSIYLKLRNLM